MISVIMAGGVGERFWPQSRRKTPKQLIDLTGKGTMLSLTLERAARFSAPEDIWILTNVEQLDAIAREAGVRVPADNIVGEPVSRNTAASIGLAAMLIERRSGDVPFMVLPADHLVDDVDAYTTAVSAAESYVAGNDALLTFGIKPTRAETGYGYVRAGGELAREGNTPVFEAASFHEKPTADKARAYVDDGGFLWNSGMFMWRAGVILEGIQRQLPDLHKVLMAISASMGTEPLEKVLKTAYPKAPSTSIDYGVMEKADNVVVVRGEFYWNDVGGWESIRGMYPEDANGNVVVGNHLLIDSANNTVFSPNRLVSLIGVEDVVVVDGGDAILVCKRQSAQRIREVVEVLKKERKELT